MHFERNRLSCECVRPGRRYWLWCMGIIGCAALGFLLFSIFSDPGQPGDALFVVEWAEILLVACVAFAAVAYLVLGARRGGMLIVRQLKRQR